MKFLVKTTLITCLLFLEGIIHPISGFCQRVDDFRVNDSIPPSELAGICVSTDHKSKFVLDWVDYSDFQNRRIYLKQFRLDGSQVSNQIEAPDIIEQAQRLNNGIGFNSITPLGNVVLVREMFKDSVDSQGNPFSFSRGYIDIFDSLGNPQVSTYLVDTVALHYSGLAADRDGNFTVLLYKSSGGPGGATYYKQFYASGEQKGNLTKVICDTFPNCDFGPQHQAISMNQDGRFIISWDASDNQFPFAGIYNSDGIPVRDEYIISCDDTVNPACVPPNTHCLSASAPKAGIDSLGNFMAAFNVCTEDLTGKHIYVRVYDSLGNPKTSSVDIDEMDNTYYFFNRPRVVATEDGGYVIVWTDRSNQIPYNKPYADIWAKRFDANGNQIGIKYRINNKVGSVLDMEDYDVAICNGHVFIVWLDIRSRPELYSSFYAQIMPADEVGMFTPGDINYDYDVNLTDLIGLVNFVFKGADPPEGSPLVCDVNGNCKVDIVDIIYIVNHLFKGGPSPVGCLF